LYRHYKQGHLYRVTGIARSGNGEGRDLVIYQRADSEDQWLWYRTVSDFESTISPGKARFERVPQEVPLSGGVSLGPPENTRYNFQMPGHSLVFSSDGQCTYNGKTVSSDTDLQKAVRAFVMINEINRAKEIK
jgi:5-methylcytosine-specific restriction endonuclease McrA